MIFPEHGHPTPIYSKVIGRKTVPDESTDVYARKSMDFGSNSVLSKSPDFMDFGLPTANTRDKLKSVIVPTTTFGRLVDGSYWLPPRHDIEEVTTERVSEKKAYSDYI